MFLLKSCQDNPIKDHLFHRFAESSLIGKFKKMIPEELAIFFHGGNLKKTFEDLGQELAQFEAHPVQ